MLYHLAYKSKCHKIFTQDAVEVLCQSFDANNRALNITGLLLCDGVYFLQVLEGERTVIEKLFEKLICDVRHYSVAKLFSAPVPSRIFSSFGMKVIVTKPGRLVDPAQLTPLFHSDIDGSIEDRTYAIIRAFTSGRWRERSVTSFKVETSPSAISECSALPRVVPFEDQLACFAFQPIVNPITKRITAVEALLRGHAGETPQAVLGQYTGQDLSLFDFRSKTSAFALARRLKIAWPLSINLLPSSLLAVENAAELLVAEAEKQGFGPRDFIVEITEEEAISNPEQFTRATDALRAAGIAVAIDDFGAGFAGLSLLATFQPDRLKIDRGLISGIDRDGPRQAILRAIVDCCVSLGIKLICEGVETEEELHWLLEHDIRDFQGFLFARPLMAGVPDIKWPKLDRRSENTAIETTQMSIRMNGRDNVLAPTHAMVDAAVTNPKRLGAVRDSGLLDAPRFAVFDRLVKTAARLVRAPVALISIVDESRDFYIASWGMEGPIATSRQLEGRTFCHYTLLSDGPLILEDVAAQDIFRDVPTIQTLGVRAYLGVPLVLSNGFVAGSFCAIDFTPRPWTDDDILVLTELAQSVQREFQLQAFVSANGSSA